MLVFEISILSAPSAPNFALENRMMNFGKICY